MSAILFTLACDANECLQFYSLCLAASLRIFAASKVAYRAASKVAYRAASKVAYRVYWDVVQVVLKGDWIHWQKGDWIHWQRSVQDTHDHHRSYEGELRSPHHQIPVGTSIANTVCACTHVLLICKQDQAFDNTARMPEHPFLLSACYQVIPRSYPSEMAGRADQYIP